MSSRRSGLLPPPYQVGVRAVAWDERELDEVLKARFAGKSQEEIRQLVRSMVAARKNAASAPRNLRLPDVMRKLGLGRTSVYALSAEGG